MSPFRLAKLPLTLTQGGHYLVARRMLMLKNFCLLQVKFSCS